MSNEFDVPELTDVRMVPATRLRPGDMLDLKGSYLLTRCEIEECEACPKARELADDGHLFEVHACAPAEMIPGIGQFYGPFTWVLVTDELVVALDDPKQCVPVKEFAEYL